jgi:photosystem II stability/assembly factor-like uncharacterized protein
MNDIQDFVYCLARTVNASQPDFASKSETSDSNGLVFAAKQSGLFRSTDGGQTWGDAYAALKLAAPLPTQAVAVTVVDDIPYVFAAVEGRILRSLDGSQTWEIASLESPAPLVTALAISPDFARDGLVLAASMQDGIFRSSDRGVTWTGWNFGLYDPNINALAFVDAQKVVAGTQSGVFVSLNAGRSWRDTEFPLENAPVQCIAVSQDQTIYAGTQADGLFASRDAGKTWETVCSGGVEQIHIQHGKIFILNDGNLLFSDDGKDWQTREFDGEISAFIVEPLLLGLANGECIHG